MDSIKVENGMKMVSENSEDKVIIVLREVDGMVYWEIGSDVTLEELIKFYRILEGMKERGEGMYREIPVLMDDAMLTIQMEIERILVG